MRFRVLSRFFSGSGAAGCGLVASAPVGPAQGTQASGTPTAPGKPEGPWASLPQREFAQAAWSAPGWGPRAEQPAAAKGERVRGFETGQTVVRRDVHRSGRVWSEHALRARRRRHGRGPDGSRPAGSRDPLARPARQGPRRHGDVYASPRCLGGSTVPYPLSRGSAWPLPGDPPAGTPWSGPAGSGRSRGKTVAVPGRDRGRSVILEALKEPGGHRVPQRVGLLGRSP
jgi:hypothetical protein